MSTNLSAWAFQPAAEEKDVDIFISRFKAMIGRYGFRFPEKNNVPNGIIAKLNSNPGQLTDEEWNRTGYPFLDIDREALIKLSDKDIITKLSQGKVEFTKKETEALEEVCGDFFDYKGLPRHSRGAPDLSLVQKNAP